MTSLDNVMKSVPNDEERTRVISIRRPRLAKEEKVEERQIDKRLLQEIEAKHIQKAEKQAAAILQKAEEAAQLKMEELKQQEANLESRMNAVLEEAKVQGYEIGYNQGRKDGEQSIQDSVEEAQQLIEVARDDYWSKLQEAEPTIVKLAIKISEKMLGSTLDAQPEKWGSAVKTALKEVKDHENIKISVHPSKYDITVQQKKELKAVVHDSTDIIIYPDEELVETACVIETSFGTIDASFDSQLSVIKKRLLEVIEETKNGQ